MFTRAADVPASWLVAGLLLLLAASRAGSPPPPVPSALTSELVRDGSHALVAVRARGGEGVYRRRVDRLAADARLTLGVPLDPNEETAEALALLPGVGSKLADAIVEDRLRRGPFRAVDDLDRVHGIGSKTLERMRPYVAVGIGAAGR